MLNHPRKNDRGKDEPIYNPHLPTPLSAWSDSSATAIVVPDGPMPDAVNGIPIRSWVSAPTDPAGWAKVTGQADIPEPEFKAPAGKKPASGAVVVESDGRVWLAAPTNGFGGYKQSFPKGKKDKELQNISLQANAIKEAYEEVGLQVTIEAYLTDSNRDTSYTRYYVARRVTGNPADMIWESQAVFLVPLDDLPKYLNNANDKPVFEKLKAYLKQQAARTA